MHASRDVSLMFTDCSAIQAVRLSSSAYRPLGELFVVIIWIVIGNLIMLVSTAGVYNGITALPKTFGIKFKLGCY